MKYRYYIVLQRHCRNRIVSLYDGNVTATDDINIANFFTASEDFWVIDAKDGNWLLAPDRVQEIPLIDPRDAT